MDEHALIVTDADAVVTQSSTGAEDLFGYPAVEVIGRRVDLIIPEHRREAH